MRESRLYLPARRRNAQARPALAASIRLKVGRLENLKKRDSHGASCEDAARNSLILKRNRISACFSPTHRRYPFCWRARVLTSSYFVSRPSGFSLANGMTSNAPSLEAGTRGSGQNRTALSTAASQAHLKPSQLCGDSAEDIPYTLKVNQSLFCSRKRSETPRLKPPFLFPTALVPFESRTDQFLHRPHKVTDSGR